MVHADSRYRKFRDLVGKTIAIPSRFAVDFIFLRKMLAKEGMSDKDVRIVEMAPPDMPAALFAKSVDAYCTGEPFGAAAQRAGYAVPLRMTRDEWPSYICCVLTVRQELIDQNPGLVQDLVNYVQGAGHWLDAEPAHRTRAAQLASGNKYFNQDPATLQFVMENPTDRVTYGDLRMVKEEFDDLMQLSLQAGTLKSSVGFDRYTDDRFVKAAVPASVAL
jgi:NitT/TauT family transport system substrate-binding protein